MANPALALLEILDKVSFRRALCIDLDENLKHALKLRCDHIFFFESKNINSTIDQSKEKFDLVISFSDNKSIIARVARLGFSKDCEILIVSNSLVNYSVSVSRKRFFERRVRRFVIVDIKKNFSDHSIESYYPFPDLNSPQMILSSSGLGSLYFRYWSWLKPDRHAISKILEVIIVKFFRSTKFSPYIIFKLTKR